MAATTPDRDLRRQPYPHEITAATDFAALDALHDVAADSLLDLFLGTLMPGYMADIRDQIATTTRGTERQRVLRTDLAKRISAKTAGADAITDALLSTAMQGAAEALDEVTAQGGTAAVDEAALRLLVADQAGALAELWADGVTLAAKRRAVQLVGAGTAREVADMTTSYVTGLVHQWEADQAAGMAQASMNAGRFHVFEQVSTTQQIYSSEILDRATCDPCREIDGRVFTSLAEAMTFYPTGGYRSCQGGNRCRGTCVVVLGTER